MRQKTETRQVYNEELGCYEWKEVETDKYVFDETDKIAIARDYHERRPAGKRRGRARQRHPHDGVALPHGHPRRKEMQGRAAAHHRILQRREAAHEREIPDAIRGIQPERVTEKMLEKSMGESSGWRKSVYLCTAKRESQRFTPPVMKNRWGIESRTVFAKREVTLDCPPVMTNRVSTKTGQQ